MSFNNQPCILYIRPPGHVLGGGIPGLNHLWFLTDIGICYIITPILQYVYEFKYGGMMWRWFLLICITCVLCAVILRYNGWHYHVLLYGIAFMMGKFRNRWEWVALFVIVVFSALMMVDDMSWELILNGGAKAYLWRVITCLLIFMMCSWAFSLLHFFWQPSVIRLLDKQSYYAYIVHHIYIIGPFSVIMALDYAYESILYVIGLIIVSSIALSQLSKFVTQ